LHVRAAGTSTLLSVCAHGRTRARRPGGPRELNRRDAKDAKVFWEGLSHEAAAPKNSVGMSLGAFGVLAVSSLRRHEPPRLCTSAGEQRRHEPWRSWRLGG